jgi:hypothetical protein
MTVALAIIAGLLVALAVFQLLLAARHEDLHRQALADVLARAQAERSSLLDRIQHPEIRQVEPARYTPPPLPQDTIELAQIGGIVPDGVHVGDPMDWVGMEIPDELHVEGIGEG